jgi:hypothetical protein
MGKESQEIVSSLNRLAVSTIQNIHLCMLSERRPECLRLHSRQSKEYYVSVFYCIKMGGNVYKWCKRIYVPTEI